MRRTKQRPASRRPPWLFAMAVFTAAGWLPGCGEGGEADSPQAEDPDQIAVIRLVDAVRYAPSHVRLEWMVPESAPNEPAIHREDFQGSLEPWLPLRSVEHPLFDPANTTVHDWRVEDGQLHGRGNQGMLLKCVPLFANQCYELKVTSTIEALQGEAVGSSSACANVGVQPLMKRVDLKNELVNTPMYELWRVQRSRINETVSLPPPQVGSRQTRSQVFQAPFDAEAGILAIMTGEEGSNPFTVDELSLSPVSLRRALGLGKLAAGVDAVDKEQVTGSSAKNAGLHALVSDSPELQGFRRVEILEERRDGVLLPAPAVLEWDVTVPDGEWILDFSHACLPERRVTWRQSPLSVKASFQFRDREVSLWDATLTADRPEGWESQQVPLPKGCTGPGTLRIAVDSSNSEDLFVLGSVLLRRKESAPRHIFLISLDTVRADRMSNEGYPRPTTPFLDELSQQSAWFRHASSTSGYTLPSHATMFSGQVPAVHGLESPAPGFAPISATSCDLLTVRLREAGFLTVGFTGGGYVSAEFGFEEGFDQYDTHDNLLSEEDARWHLHPRRNDYQANLAFHRRRGLDHVVDWVDDHSDSRFFLFLHTYLVHNYRPSPAYREQFHPTCESDLGDSLKWVKRRVVGQRELPPEDLAHYEDLYDATLREADDLMREFVDALRSSGVWDRSLVIVTSDHGEEFHDHGNMGHGHTLYQELLHIPLLIHGPGFTAQECSMPVSLSDITPTILDWVGERPRFPVQGRSLLPVLRTTGTAGAEDPVFARLVREQGMPLYAVRRGPWKLIATKDSLEGDDEAAMLFDLEEDPQEHHDLRAEREDVAAPLLRYLRRANQEHEDLGARRERDSRDGISPEMEDQLRRLGYLDDSG